MRKLTGFIITAGHLDIEWYQPMRSYRFWTIEALEQLKQAACREDFKTYVLDGQIFPLLEYLEVLPEEEKRFRELIENGKLSVGPFYTQFDEWIPSAESMIRNCLWGKRESMRYGGYMRAGYLPDNFGHPRQLPQILQNFGIDSLMFMRGMPEIEGGHPDEFQYEGLDGSRVLVSHFRESYSGGFDIFRKVPEQLGEPEGELDCRVGIDALQPRDLPYYEGYLSYEWHKELADHDEPQSTAKSLISNVKRIQQRFPSGVVPLIAGFDHLPPQINIGDSVRAANEMQDEIEFVMGSAEDYVRAVQARNAERPVYCMELLGSRYQGLLLGALSSRTYLKRQNFAAEAMVERYAEPLETMAVLAGFRKKKRLLEEAWKYLLINSAHDSIHGSSVDEVHVEMEGRYAAVRQIAAGVVHEAMKYLGKRMEPWWGADKKGILIYAPAGGNGAQACEVWLPVRRGQVRITDAEGRRLPVQILPREKIERNGLGLPRNESFPNAMFQKVLFLTAPGSVRERELSSFAAELTKEREDCETDLRVTGNAMENRWIRVEIKKTLIDLLDKRSGKWYRNLNLLEEEADAGDVWDYSAPWIPGETVRSAAAPFCWEIAEQGPVRACMKLSTELCVPECLEGDWRSSRRISVPLCFELYLYADTPRLDVRLTVENRARDHRIRLAVPTGLCSDTVRSQGHLAVIDRPVVPQRQTEPWVQPPPSELPFREWVSVENEKNGFAVAVKGIYAYEAVRNPGTGEVSLYFTLLRGVELMSRINTMQRKGHAAWPFKTPGAQCLQKQSIEWSYLPYQPDRQDAAPFIREAQRFLYPPAAHMVRDIQEQSIFGKRAEAPCGWEERNIQFSAFKQTYENDAYILRVYENQGKRTKFRIRLDERFVRVWESDMDERPKRELVIENGSVEAEAAPYQAVTLRMEAGEEEAR